MELLPTWKLARHQMLGLYISLALAIPSAVVYATEVVEFNTNILDVNDRKNIDLSQFSRSGYIMPGSYGMVVHINKDELPEQAITFYASPDDPNSSRVCITRVLAEELGLKSKVLKDLTWWHEGECLDEGSLPGMEARGDLSTSSLYLSIPQAYLEYTAENWDPPARWDEGIPGLLLDYNINSQTQKNRRQGTNGYSLSANGVTGANLGSWRLRADW